MPCDVNYLGEGIDRLVCIDLKSRGIIYPLYEAARSLVNKPLTSTAAKLIVENLKAKEVGIITTGFRLPPLGVQETDGILGAASLAKALRTALNAKPILLIEENSTAVLMAILKSLGEKTTVVLGLPTRKLEEAKEKAEEILDEYSPAALIAIEKAGCNNLGEYHTMKGENVTNFHTKIEAIVEKAWKKGTVTLAIGDGGNEVGMGNIKEVVERIVPYATQCCCPCKSGIASQSKVDLLIPAAISNWGAYGIQTCIAWLTQKPEVLHTSEMEQKMLKTAINVGAIDGLTRKNELSVDGIPMNIHSLIIKLLQAFLHKENLNAKF
jgi:hypothetical protein